MHALKMLHQLLEKNCPDIHRRRLSAMMTQVQALMFGQTLTVTVTGLGRSRVRTIGMKHVIKQSDRLIGNTHLNQERQTIYQVIARVLLHRISQPLISINWSDYTYDRSMLLLRAAVAVGGPYPVPDEEVHPLPPVSLSKTWQGHKARSKHSQKNARREQLPWVLVTSLDGKVVSAQQVIQLYRTRMQIEESFRDIKNQRIGFSLSDTRSYSLERLANLLLIGMLATWVVWLTGRLAEEKQLHYHYQANTVKPRRVLSLFYLGCLLIRQGQIQFTQREYHQAIKLIRYDMLTQWNS